MACCWCISWSSFLRFCPSFPAPPAGIVYLYVKTIERAHSPRHQWERIKLSNKYSTALEQVSFLFRA